MMVIGCIYITVQFSSFQSLSRVRLFVTPWIAARQASLSITISRNSSKLMSIESVMPSGHLILCRPLLLLPPIPPSIRVFSNESTLRMRWPKYWSFSFSIINGTPLQYSCLENPMDRGSCSTTVYGVAKSWTWLSNFTFTSKEHPVLISFRMDWLDLLAVQGTLKSILQHHSSKASILQCSAFFTV